MDLTETIVPNSDQLDACDLLTGPRTFTIESVSKGNTEQPVQIKLAEFPRVWRPGKSMRRVLVACWGKDGAAYAGRRVRLYCDPEVRFGGAAVGGTRISHLSHIDKPQSVPLLVTRGKSAMFTVHPLTDEPSAPIAASKPDAITPAQLKKLQTVYSELGITDRAERLADASKVVGRSVPSANDLSRDEAHVLIDDLERRASSHEPAIQDVPLPDDDPGPDPWSTAGQP